MEPADCTFHALISNFDFGTLNHVLSGNRMQCNGMETLQIQIGHLRLRGTPPQDKHETKEDLAFHDDKSWSFFLQMFSIFQHQSPNDVYHDS